jgi:predicted metalloprotease with PDZ domain
MKSILFLLFASFLPMTMIAAPTIAYRLGMPKPSTHLFEVEIRFDGLDSTEKSLDVSLPNWRSGRYMILDLASGVVEFDVVDGANSRISWRKAGKSTWRIETNGVRQVRVQYKVFANEFHLRTRGVNDERAFVDGAAVFMYSETYRWLPLTLNVVPFGNWHVTTGLDSVVGERNKFTAPHYDYLADCPLEIGTQRDFSFEVLGKEHVLSIAGEGNFDVNTLTKDIAKIVEAQAKFWGGD